MANLKWGSRLNFWATPFKFTELCIFEDELFLLMLFNDSLKGIKFFWITCYTILITPKTLAYGDLCQLKSKEKTNIGLFNTQSKVPKTLFGTLE